MIYLLDTCLISEQTRPKLNTGVAAWLARIAIEDTAICAATVGEIQKGIDMLSDARRKAVLQQWLHSQLIEQFADRILPFTTATALIWGQMDAQCQRSGLTKNTVDLQIAATARQHSLIVVTRNDRDFEPLGVEILNPFA